MSATRPNVVIVVADDLGYGDLGHFNEGHCRSPALDALAQEGICLTQHYSGSPVCAPARAALLTGRYPHRTGAIDTLQGRGLDRIALGEVTLADHFRAAGYRTGLIGKWHNGDLDARYHPNARGFEEFVGFSGGYSDYYDYTLDNNGSQQRGDGRYLTDVLSEQAVSFVRRHAAEPFFLLVAYNAPHFPMQAPQELVDRYLAQGETLGAALTYAMIEVMDAGVGRINETLHDLGLAENTFLMFTSDNGPYLGEVAGVSLDRFNYGLRGAKHYVFEGGIRVPAIVRWPAAIAGERIVTEMLHFTDWLPTLAAAAGIESPEASRLDGHDVSAVLNGDSSAVDPVRFWQNNRYGPRVEGNAAMRDGNWKLVRPTIPDLMRVTESDRAIDRALNLNQPDRITHVDTSQLPEFDIGEPPAALLFDVAADPFEQHDLAAEQPDRVARMTGELERWFESVEADRRSIPDDWSAIPV
ncbi:MAG: sulfatase-like hydrolase/transferase [Gaiellaceae bacterium]